jgi:tRNA threonylcarbamoyl adenosine modification protein YeaZ
MIVLGFDPLSLRAGAALLVDDTLFGPRLGHTPERGRSASTREELLALAAALLDECKISVDQLDGVGLVNGPGSMTGIRIGVATVRGLLFGRETPVVGVSTLDAITFLAPDAMPAIQLRKNDWFVRVDHETRLMTPIEMDSLPAGVTIASSGKLPPLERVPTRFLDEGLAAAAARLAFAEISAGRGTPPDRLAAAYHADTYAT